MTKVAVYGKEFKASFKESIATFFEILTRHKATPVVYLPLFTFLKRANIDTSGFQTFEKPDEIDPNTKFFFSIGGDGTFLETIQYVKKWNIPVVGINSGRLGFLADISSSDIEIALASIFSGLYKIEERVLLKLSTGNNLFGEQNYALNELTIHKKDSSSMITIHTYINDEYLNSYWADGLIVSTPTGSTAYSLSVGGPIVLPNSENFIISPIAPHTLTVRPLIISDNNILRFTVEGRSNSFLASLDHRSASFTSKVALEVAKADFTVKIIKLENQSFFSTLRTKLMWGIDKRN
jgi:NAD+ kinase